MILVMQRYQVYGEDPRPRSAEDIAFAVALFIAKKNGSFVNYYMVWFSYRKFIICILLLVQGHGLANDPTV